MHPFRLAIAKPCPEDWNSMTGTEQQKHCASCNHDVVALAEMTPEDAVALIRNARPHSLCLRIEHDDDGTVIFRQNASRMNSAPLLMLTIGASMLLTACNESSPTAPAPDIPSSVATQSVNQDKPAAIDSMPPAQETNGRVGATEKTMEPVGQPASSVAANPHASDNGRTVKSTPSRATRVTTGCACAVGDRLCDCL